MREAAVRGRRISCGQSAQRAQLSAFLGKAKTQLLIYDPKVSDIRVIKLLKERAKAGVDVRIIGKLGGKKSQLNWEKYPGRRLHVRAIIRDGRQAFFGSQSLRRLELDTRREREQASLDQAESAWAASQSEISALRGACAQEQQQAHEFQVAALQAAQELDRSREREQQIEGLKVVFTMTEDPGWQGETRRIDADFIREQLDSDLGSYTYIVSGPPGMVNGVADQLEDEGVPEEQVIRSRFSGY